MQRHCADSTLTIAKARRPPRPVGKVRRHTHTLSLPNPHDLDLTERSARTQAQLQPAIFGARRTSHSSQINKVMHAHVKKLRDVGESLASDSQQSAGR